MSLSIKDFKAIANGSYNIGQIKLNDAGTGLQKINNHVWRTGKNNVQMTAEQNRAVRTALVNAFKNEVSSDRLNEIRTILLGSGNETRSLGRDFVKKLIDTATDSTKANDNIVGSMEKAEKQLLNRNVRVMGERSKVDEGLMTSTRLEAYETYASEAMDLASVRAYDGMVALSRAASSKESARAVNDVFNGVKELLDNDARTKALGGIVNQKGNGSRSLVENLDDISTGFLSRTKELAGLPNGGNLIAARLEAKIRELYDTHGIPEQVRNDHFARLFPQPAYFADSADALRENFKLVSSNEIFSSDRFSVEANLLAVYTKVLGQAIGQVIKGHPDLSEASRGVASKRMASLLSGPDPEDTRVRQVFNIYSDAAKEVGDVKNDAGKLVCELMAKKFEARISEDVRFVFQGLPHGDEIASETIAALIRLGMGQRITTERLAP